MMLREWMSLPGCPHTPTSFAAAVGVERSTVHEWLNGKHRPHRANARRVEAATGGAVTYTDLLLGHLQWHLRGGDAVALPEAEAA